MFSLRQIHDGHEVLLTAFKDTNMSDTDHQTRPVPSYTPKATPYLLLRGILEAQLLKDPDTNTSLAAPAHLNTVGLACGVGLLLSLSRSCCQARNS